MIRVLGTHRPDRIDKGVMETLLNIVHNALLEIRWIFAEQPKASNGLRHNCLVTGSNCLDEVTLKQANDSVSIGLRDWAVCFSALSHILARCAIRDPVPNHNVTWTEHIRTDDAHAAEVIKCPKRLPACEAGNWGITAPHGSFLTLKDH
jgi:hypothetical protein